MKRKITHSFLTFFLLLALLLPTFSYPAATSAAPQNDASRLYQATQCVSLETQEPLYCGEDSILFRTDSTGTITADGTDYNMTWTIQDGILTIVDQDGDRLVGSFSDDGHTLTGEYLNCRYSYGFQPDGALSDTRGPQGDTGEDLPGTYMVTTCSGNAYAPQVDRDYILLNADNTGVIVENGAAFSIQWQLDGQDFTFVDNQNGTFSGTLSQGTIEGSYWGYDYTWQKTVSPSPITAFAPDFWNNGLPLVYDQADILTDEQEQTLLARAKEITARYQCRVYIVTADDMDRYCTSRNIETFAEELRAGYRLGYGTEQNMVMLVMSMAERDYDLMAHGNVGNTSFTDYGKEELASHFLDDFKKDNWYKGFSDYLTQCNEFLELAAQGKPVDVGAVPRHKTLGDFIACLVFAFLISLIVASIIKSRTKSIKVKTEADEYIPHNGCVITYRQDAFTHTTQTRTYVPPSESRSGGGHSGGTHTSHSGSSHSSGKF